MAALLFLCIAIAFFLEMINYRKLAISLVGLVLVAAVIQYIPRAIEFTKQFL